MTWFAGRGGMKGGIDFERSRPFETMQEAGIYALDQLAPTRPNRGVFVAEGENTGGNSWLFGNVHIVTRMNGHVFFQPERWP
jgi:hypothetical protein